MTVQNLYTQYLDGKITKQKFLYEVRRDQNLDMISPSNSFDDVVRILKNKSIISEKAHKESTGKQEVDIIAKTIDMVNPYEYTKGMEYELDIMDVPATSGDLSEENVAKAQKKVLTNLTKNPRYYTEKICGKGEVSEEWVEATKKEIDKIGKGKPKVIREGVEDGLKQMGYSESDIEDFMDEYKQGGSKLPKKVKDYLDSKKEIKKEGIHDRDITSAPHTNVKGEMGAYDPKARASSLAKLKNFGPKEGDVSAIDIAQALIPLAANKGEIVQYFQSLSKAGHKFDTVDDYVEDFKNYVADKSLEEAIISPDNRVIYVAHLLDMVWKRGRGNNSIDFEDLAQSVIDDLFDEDKSLEENKDADLKIYKSELNMLNKIKPTGEKQLKRKEFLEKEIAKLEKGINEHGEYFDRVSDMNISQSPLEEKRLRIYEKYAQKMDKTVDEVKTMVDEAIALKDRAGNIQYAKDSTEASNIEKNAKSKGITLTKTAV